MFPLTHTYLMSEYLTDPDFRPARDYGDFERELFLVGGVIPDMVVGMGLDRVFGHSMGPELYAFCSEKYPEALPFALGVWLHGIDPCGFDYYADEHWQGAKGWCFQRCAPYVPEVVAACQIPEEWGLWKGHNCVEMACDHLCAQKKPDLGATLIAARSDPRLQELVTRVMHDFAAVDPQKALAVTARIGEAFAILDVSFEELGNKYARQLLDRHDLTDARPLEIAALLARIAHDLEGEFWLWYEEVKAIIRREIQNQLAEREPKTSR